MKRKALMRYTADVSAFLIELPGEDLRYIDKAVAVVADADADLCPGSGENVTAVPVGGHESRLRFFNRCMVCDILACTLEAVAEAAEHVAHATVGG